MKKEDCMCGGVLRKGLKVITLESGEYGKVGRGAYGTIRDNMGGRSNLMSCGYLVSTGINSDWFNKDELRIVEDTPSASYEIFGRNEGELYEGDVISTANYGVLEVKSVHPFEVYSIGVTIDGHGDALRPDQCTLITPVEQRIDKLG